MSTPTITTSPNYNGADGFTVVGHAEGVSAEYALDILTTFTGDRRESVRLLVAAETAYWQAVEARKVV